MLRQQTMLPEIIAHTIVKVRGIDEPGVKRRTNRMFYVTQIVTCDLSVGSDDADEIHNLSRVEPNEISVPFVNLPVLRITGVVIELNVELIENRLVNESYVNDLNVLRIQR